MQLQLYIKDKEQSTRKTLQGQSSQLDMSMLDTGSTLTTTTSTITTSTTTISELVELVVVASELVVVLKLNSEVNDSIAMTTNKISLSSAAKIDCKILIFLFILNKYLIE